MTEPRTHVVVLGGGYAGTLAANHLRLRADVDVTLVNPRPVFVERIRLHQFAAGNRCANVDYGTLLGEGIALVTGTAERIERSDRTVTLSSGDTMAFDYLIYAVGSGTAAPEFTYPVAEYEQAAKLRAALDELHPDAPVTMVGGGFCGAGSGRPQRTSHRPAGPVAHRRNADQHRRSAHRGRRRRGRAVG